MPSLSTREILLSSSFVSSPITLLLLLSPTVIHYLSPVKLWHLDYLHSVRWSGSLIKVIYSKVWMRFNPLGKIYILKMKLVRQLGFFPPVNDMGKEIFLSRSLRHILFALCAPTHKALFTFAKENNIGNQPSRPMYLPYPAHAYSLSLSLCLPTLPLSLSSAFCYTFNVIWHPHVSNTCWPPPCWTNHLVPNLFPLQILSLGSIFYL